MRERRCATARVKIAIYARYMAICDDSGAYEASRRAQERRDAVIGASDSSTQMIALLFYAICYADAAAAAVTVVECHVKIWRHIISAR